MPGDFTFYLWYLEAYLPICILLLADTGMHIKYDLYMNSPLRDQSPEDETGHML